MPRPKPKVLLEWTDPKTYITEQIIRTYAIYAVCYDGRPINLKKVNSLEDVNATYKTVSFQNAGHAFNLAEKLNKKYRTNKFAVYKFSNGTKIEEDEI